MARFEGDQHEVWIEKINIQSATTRGDWEVVYVMLPSVYFGISFESKNCPLLPSGTKRQCAPGQGESWGYSVSLGLPIHAFFELIHKESS